MNNKIAVIIPCYREKNTILDVLSTLPNFVDYVVVVDDGCPDQTGKLVEAKAAHSNQVVLFHEVNQGLGAAMQTGYRWVLENTDADILVKLDGDGQMDPDYMAELVSPLLQGHSDYAKGNRFSSIEDLEQMPKLRIFGNAVLSLMSKLSSGYWNITDPTNGYTAVTRKALSRIKVEKLSRSFFFESDMLFRLSLVRAVVTDVPMPAVYGTEKSQLKIRKIIWLFQRRHTVNFVKRILYNYYLREWNVASIELPLGLALFLGGAFLGATSWTSASAAGLPATSGQVMLAAVPIILGFQLILAFLSYDVASVPKSRNGSAT